MNTIIILKTAGLLHLAMLCAGACVPRVTGLFEHTTALPPFLRQLFLVYFGFIAGLIICFGSITFFLADALASGTPLAKAVCGLLLLFWTARTFVAWFVFDMRPYLTNTWRKVGYQLLNLGFHFLVFAYAWALITGGQP